MGRTPELSVIIPTYNRADLLKRAVDSVLTQSYSDYEVIIVDDGSTDQTDAILEEYRRKNGDVVKTFRQKNSGKSIALNEALALAKGEWIAFLDSDDYWHPKKLERQFEAIRRFGDSYGVCFTDGRYINNPNLPMTLFEYSSWKYAPDMGVIPDALDLILIGNHGVYMQTMIVKKELVFQAGLFDPKLKVSHDTDFFFHLARLTKFCFVNETLAYIDRTVNRTVGLIEILVEDRPRLEERQHMYEKWLSVSSALDTRVRKTIMTRLQEVHSEWANWYLKGKGYPEARRSLRTAAHFEITMKVAVKYVLATAAPGVVRRVLLQRARARAQTQVLA